MNKVSFKRYAIFMLVVLFAVSTTGCEAFRKKFIRKNKKTESYEEVIAAPEEYSTTPPDIAYDSHFTYWKYWVQELIERLDVGSSKKVRECFDFALREINEMKRFLPPDKQKELQEQIQDLESLSSPIRAGNLTDSEILFIKKKLENHRINVEQKFCTKKASQWVK